MSIESELRLECPICHNRYSRNMKWCAGCGRVFTDEDREFVSQKSQSQKEYPKINDTPKEMQFLNSEITHPVVFLEMLLDEINKSDKIYSKKLLQDIRQQIIELLNFSESLIHTTQRVVYLPNKTERATYIKNVLDYALLGPTKKIQSEFDKFVIIENAMNLLAYLDREYWYLEVI